MTDFSYTILIPVLLLLLAAMVGMLYARFVTRSRENSEEVDLVDVELSMSNVSVAESDAEEVAPDESERVSFLEPDIEFLEPEVEVSSIIEWGAPEIKEEVKPSNKETEYFDELQEAAAGLAALMRSSPVGKSDPVVYAPDELDDVSDEIVESDDEPQEILLPVAESISEPVVEESVEVPAQAPLDESFDVEKTKLLPATATEAPVESELSVAVAELPETEPVVQVADESQFEPVSEEAAMVTDDVATELVEPESNIVSIRALLGEEVADQFDSLDDGLSDLEDLVGSIESALLSLNDGLEEIVSVDEGEMVSEAA